MNYFLPSCIVDKELYIYIYIYTYICDVYEYEHKEDKYSDTLAVKKENVCILGNICFL